ncbi:TetR/AcrR family transcriptional regulator [Mucilaginibacter robiniae]|uniref:TetR/AcrR family transcriptional regulator n=1 Tax=Mucilaginibacter robiniae TaxID=2728022 RepID=A0A7L5E683_9SPHI|nr:TetR/AcrR family transcriptional regulator [Mucilaginibacter robiniae]QJD95886.1 TetR/AcrR family transcriptional regulator [Mucilaginibacter robiniae]
MISFLVVESQYSARFIERCFILINRLINFVSVKDMEKEKTDKKDHILDVAERVFAEHGFDGASTRMISGEAGVNMAMLNYYFGSKEGLFLAIFERRTATFYTQLQDIGSDDSIGSWDKVEQYLNAYIDRIFTTSCFQKMLYQEMSISRRGELTDKLSKMLMTNVIEFRKILHAGIEKGEFASNLDTDMIIATVFGIKNFMLNTPQMCSMMFGYDIMDPQNLDEKLKPRVKSYFKKLLKAYLVNGNDNSKQ